MNLFKGGDKSDDGKKSEGGAAAGGDKANASVAGSDGSGEGGGSKVGNMPEGDYVIHVLIIQAKSIHLEGEDTSDPLIKVTCMDVNKQSKNKTNISTDETVKFNEHVFLEFNGLKKEQLGEANVTFDIQNKGFFKGDDIGRFEIPLSKIYNMDKHCLINQTIGCNNVNSKDFSKITGYITVSVNVTGPGDEAEELKAGTAAEIAKIKPMLPSSIKKVYKQLHMRFFIAENLPIMDSMFGTIDAYVKLTFGDSKLKTRVYKMKDNRVEWFQEMLIPVTIPIQDDKLKFEIYDQDAILDELACTVQFSLKSLCKNTEEHKLTKWVNFYGAHNGYSGKNSKKMNEDPGSASSWKGRMMIQSWAEDVKYPIFKLIDLKDPQIFKQVETTVMKPREWQIWIEFCQGICLPKSKPYHLKFVLGNIEIESGAPIAKGENYNRWDKRVFKDWKDTFQSSKRFPTFFIYLMDEDKPICYHRDTVENYMSNPDAPVNWDEFERDKSVSKVDEDWKAGLFSFRLYFRDATKDGKLDYNTIQSWKKPLPKRQSAYKMRVSIYQAESLPPADSSGTSDPYVEVWTPNKEKVLTRTINDTNNPIYYQVLEIPFEFSSQDRARPIILNLFDTDEDLFDSTDDFIGRSVIFLHQINEISSTDAVPYPCWHPVKQGYEDEYDPKYGGAILCSFQLVDFDFNFAMPAHDINLHEPFSYKKNIPYPMPSLDINEFKCEIVVLGLRNLISGGLLPVKKAFVKFGIKSLLAPDQAKAVANITTLPKEVGSNPTIRTTIQFEVKIPSDPTFTPRMTCDVYDQIFFEGMAQPHLGTFTLKFGDIIQEARSHDREVIQEFEDIVNTLKDIVKQQNADKTARVKDLMITISKQALQRQTTLPSVDDTGAQLLKQMKKDGVVLPGSNGLKGQKGNLVLPKKPEPSANNPIHSSESCNSFVEDNKSEAANKMLGVLDSNMRKNLKLMHEAQAKKDQEKIAKTKREVQEALLEKGDSIDHLNMIKPKYQWSERLKIEVEVNPPPKEMFMELGHDSKPGGGEKHYRRYYSDELENIKDPFGELLIETPFLAEKVTRMKQVKSGGLLGGLFGGDDGVEEQVQEVGLFKGLVYCYIPRLKLERRGKMRAACVQMLKLIQPIYELDLQKKFEFNVDEFLRRCDDQDYDFETCLIELKAFNQELGIGALKIVPKISSYLSEIRLAQKLNEITECKIRLYLLEGYNFAQRDLFSASDPFLVIKVDGKVMFNEEENYQLDCAEPKFYKCYEITRNFPGCPRIDIIAYDYDDFFGNEIIGLSWLDLDDRFFSQSWATISIKPIEYRDLYEETSSISQGVIKMWVEIYEKDQKEANEDPVDISPPPVEDMMVRFIVWKTKEIENMDWEGCSDIFCRSYFDSENDITTDTHWRCRTGKGSFNWRHQFLIKNNLEDYNFTIQAWDRDIIASNDLIGTAEINFTPLMKDAILTQRSQALTKKYWKDYMKKLLIEEYKQEIAYDIDWEEDDKFWVPIKRYNEEADVYIGSGYILCSVSIMPTGIADKNKQGDGRSEPNNDPNMPGPVGRIEFTLNPFKMLSQLLGDDIMIRVYMCLLSAACCTLVVMMFPMIISNLISSLIIDFI